MFNCERNARAPLAETCEVRSWQAATWHSLVTHANNRNDLDQPARSLPASLHARRRPRVHQRVPRHEPETVFAIAVDGMAVGGIGVLLQQDVERVSAEIGYWLGEPFWGRGIATEAVRRSAATRSEEHGLTRIFALPFAFNTASCRVLEKAGYTLEARLRRSAIKDGQIVDQLQYALITPFVTTATRM